MRNPTDDGKRYLYLWEMQAVAQASYRTLGAIDISAAPSIAEAAFYDTGMRGPVMLYATARSVGRIMYDHLAMPWAYVGSDLQWTAPAGEVITAMKFMKHTGENLAERADSKYLFVATWNEAAAEGRVHVLQANVTSGELLSQPVASYGGFGRIKDMCYKVQ
jgi:hypothetical protein